MRRPSSLIAFITVIIMLVAPRTGSSLSLSEGIKIVTGQGREISIARADEDVARESVSLARSPWLPSIDLYARETWLRYQPAVKVPVGSFYTSQDQFFTYGIWARQVLYDFGKTSSSVTAARETLRAREASTFRTRNRAAIEFIFAYIDLIEAGELLKVAQDEVVLYQAHLSDAEARFRAGVVTRNEVLQADVMLTDSQQRLLTAENTRSLRASRVNSLVMRPLNDPVQVLEPVGTPPIPAALEEVWTAAEQDNPDIRDLEARISAKDSGVTSIRSEYLPTVFVAGGYEYSENEYQVHPNNWSLVAGVNVNLFAGGATSARVGVARSELVALKVSREKLIDAVRLEAKSAWLDLQSSRMKIKVAQTAVAQATENLRLARLRYKEGVGTSTDVTDAVTLLTTAETNASRAAFGLKRAEAALLHIMGRDLDVAYGGGISDREESAP